MTMTVSELIKRLQETTSDLDLEIYVTDGHDHDELQILDVSRDITGNTRIHIERIR